MKVSARFSTTHIILLSFLLAILVGSLLLWLPISSANGTSVSYVDALFTATTATCVTGLVTLPTVTTWSLFGQAVILVLIQVGGLGIITVMSGLMIVFRRKMGLKDRLLLQDAFNLNTLSGLIRFVKKVIAGTLAVEGAGALLYLPVFLKDFGLKGIWISVFTSVSAFCNAGIDLISLNSLVPYVTHPWINLVTCLLIVLGGIGFVVWWDLFLTTRTHPRHPWRNLSLHSKIALSATLLCIVGGGFLIFLFEQNNPLTIGNLSWFQKIQASLFQSVTTRTAGFFTIDQAHLTTGSTLVSMILMFMGGSPVGTAGGVKTVTVVILLASALATVQRKSEVSLFHRTISKDALQKAIAVVFTSLAIFLCSTLLLAAVCHKPLTDLLYETVSATATVGLSRNLTGDLNVWGKWIIIFTMYLGRVGPISLALAFRLHPVNRNRIHNPVEDISVG